MAGIADTLKNGYFFFEDRYYGLLDRINNYIPIYKVVDPIDRVVPSFILCILLIILLLAYLFLFALPGLVIGPTSFTATIKVVDNKNSALEGVKIELLIGDKNKSLSTDKNGQAKIEIDKEKLKAEASFEKTGFQSLAKEISLIGDGIVSVTLHPVPAPPDPEPSEKRIKVVDKSTGHLITEEVTVSFSCTGGGSSPQSQSGETGEFTVIKPANCPIIIATAEAEDYRKESRRLSEEETIIPMAPDTSGTLGSINVVVSNTDGNAEPDVTVRIIEEPLTTTVATKSTTLNGTAFFQGLRPGSYTVTASAQDGRAEEKTGVSVTAGQITLVSITLPVLDPSAEGKKIYLKLVEQGTSDVIEDAQALIYNHKNILIYTLLSDSSGLVEKELADPGPAYHVMLSHPDFVTKLESNVPLLELSETEPITVALTRVETDPPNPTSGDAVVTVVDEDYEPVKDALVNLFYSQHPGIPLTAQPGSTIDDGTFTFQNLGPGSYFAKARSKNGAAEGSSQAGALAAGQTLQLEIQLVLGTGTVEATVYDAESESDMPIPGATVELLDADDLEEVIATCTTDSRGKCESEPIAADKVVYAKAKATGFVSSIEGPIDIVNKNKSSVSLGLMHESSIPPTSGPIDSQFEYFCSDSECKHAISTITSADTGTRTYYAKFNLVLAKDALYTDIMEHIRVGPDSQTDLPVAPEKYKIKVTGFDGPLFEYAMLSSCWNNDDSNPFTDPVDCPAFLDAKQVNAAYPSLEGPLTVPLILRFAIQSDLPDGTELEIHHKAKAKSDETQQFSQSKVILFKINEPFCESGGFTWSLNLTDSSGDTFPIDLGQMSEITTYDSYTLSYSIYNCTGRDFNNAALSIENKEPYAISFTASQPHDFGPVDLPLELPLRNEAITSGSIDIYSLAETALTQLELTFVPSPEYSEQLLLSFTIASESEMAVELVPEEVPTFNAYLNGTVTDAESGSEIEGAFVSLTISEARVKSATTNANGEFSFPNIDSLEGITSISLTITKAGYQTLESEVGVIPPEEPPDPLEDPRLDCVTVEKDTVTVEGEPKIEFIKNPVSPPSDTFTIVNGCSRPVKIKLWSELETQPQSDFTIAAGDSSNVTVKAETINSSFDIYMGEYAVYVLAKFASEPDLAPFAGPVGTARIYVTGDADPETCFRLGMPSPDYLRDDPNSMKSSFGISTGLSDGLIVNTCFEYFEDARLPKINEVYSFSAVESMFSIIFDVPVSSIPKSIEKQKVIDTALMFDEAVFEFNVLPSGGYAFIEWVDFFLTDGRHNSGDRHKVSAQVYPNVWAEITKWLPYTPAQSGLPHPIVDNLGFVDTDTYYPESAKFETDVTQDPIWQGQHNVCGRTLAGFEEELLHCPEDEGGLPPYKVNQIVDKLKLEVKGNAGTELAGLRWRYLSTDTNHKGMLDFKIQNNAVMGERFAIIEAEDTIDSNFVRQDPLVVDWVYSVMGIKQTGTRALRVKPAKREKSVIPAGGYLAVSVNEAKEPKFKPFDSDATFDDLYGKLAAPKKRAKLKPLQGFMIQPSADQNRPLEEMDNTIYYYLYVVDEGWTHALGQFDILPDEPDDPDVAGEAMYFDTRDAKTDEPIKIDVIVFKNEGTHPFYVDIVELYYLVVSSEETEAAEGQVEIGIGEDRIIFDSPDIDWHAFVLPEYESIQYKIETTTPEVITYFEDSKRSVTENNEEKIIAAISTPEKAAETKTERFHIRLVGPSEEQCIGEGGRFGDTGPVAKPRVQLDWDWESIKVDSCSPSNEDFVYCDSTQFTVTLMKRLEQIRKAAEEGTHSALEFERMKTFKAYLIEDAYPMDFREDFVSFYEDQLLFGELSVREKPWREYLLDSERLVFDTENARPDPDYAYPIADRVVAAGLHEVYLEIDFENDPYEFFYSDGETAWLTANITAHFTKEEQPVTTNPFYYLPFNGEVGLEAGVVKREGYGLTYTNYGDPITIVSGISGVVYNTAAGQQSNARKLIYTDKETGFKETNMGEKGIVLRIEQDLTQMKFSPSIATPVLLEMKSENDKAEAYYYLRTAGTDGVGLVSGAGFMNTWYGVGSSMKNENNVCYDFSGNPAASKPEDSLAASDACDADADASYGFVHDPAPNDEKMYFETVFYMPEEMTVHLRKSCDNSPRFYSTEESTDSLDMPVSLGWKNSRTRIASIDDVFSLIDSEYVCVSSDSDAFYFWWNPQKILQDLDERKEELLDEDVDCSLAEST